jgi:hypothetical protein
MQTLLERLKAERAALRFIGDWYGYRAHDNQIKELESKIKAKTID